MRLTIRLKYVECHKWDETGRRVAVEEELHTTDAPNLTVTVKQQLKLLY